MYESIRDLKTYFSCLYMHAYVYWMLCTLAMGFGIISTHTMSSSVVQRLPREQVRSIKKIEYSCDNVTLYSHIEHWIYLLLVFLLH